MNKDKIHIMIFSHGLISGAFRMMMDILENINMDKFKIFVTYKPEYAQLGTNEINHILRTGSGIVPLRGKRLFDLRGFIDLWNAIHEKEIDILHCWDVLGVPGRIIGKLAGVKVVESLANPPPVFLSEISLKHYVINKITSVFVDGYIACSNEVLKRYREQRPVYLNGKIVSAVYNCVEIPNLDLRPEMTVQVRKRYNLGTHEKVLTNIGYFNIQKAQKDLLQAFKIISDKITDIRLFIIGWGTLETELKDLAQCLGLTDKVIFTGKIERPQVFEILSITDLFVLSSHWEGFGIVLTEAMALRKPVVSTDTDGSREIVEDGKTGFLVPINNPDMLAEKVLELLGKQELMVKMGHEGFERVKRLFNSEQYIKGYEAFYDSIITMNQ